MTNIKMKTGTKNKQLYWGGTFEDHARWNAWFPDNPHGV